VFEVGKYSNRLCVCTAVTIFDIVDCPHAPIMVPKLPYVCHRVSTIKFFVTYVKLLHALWAAFVCIFICIIVCIFISFILFFLLGCSFLLRSCLLLRSCFLLRSSLLRSCFLLRSSLLRSSFLRSCFLLGWRLLGCGFFVIVNTLRLVDCNSYFFALFILLLMEMELFIRLKSRVIRSWM
jgi:hypothetical protein